MSAASREEARANFIAGKIASGLARAYVEKLADDLLSHEFSAEGTRVIAESDPSIARLLEAFGHSCHLARPS